MKKFSENFEKNLENFEIKPPTQSRNFSSKSRFLVETSFKMSRKKFSCARQQSSRYLEGFRSVVFYNGNKIMVIRRTNPFLLKETFIREAPLNAGFGNRFFIWSN